MNDDLVSHDKLRRFFQMSPEELQKLCAELRNADLPDQPMCDEAADELERLAQRIAELEQRDRDIANDIRALARWI